MSDAQTNSHIIFRKKGPLRVIAIIILWSFFNEFIIYGAKLHKLYERIKSRLNKLFSIIWRDYFPRVIASVTIIAFLATTVPADVAWAARTSVEPLSVSPTESGSPNSSSEAKHNKYLAKEETVKELNVETFNLPQYLGHVRDSWIPANRNLSLDFARDKQTENRIVIHVQDAHCNYNAQHRIADIIEYLNEEYGIDTVNLEGGKGTYDLSAFTRIYDEDIREEVADYFVKEGLVNGAEYFAINNPDKVSLWGIEDTKLYLENLNIYRESLKYKGAIDKYLKELDHILGNLKRHIYSNELLELDTKYTQYKENILDFKNYLNYLIEKAKHRAIDIRSLPNLYLLNQALIEEEKIDFRKADIEKGELIDEFEKMLSTKDLEKLVSETIEFKAERISRKEFYTYLVKKAKLMNLDLKKYPELQRYIVYISMDEAIDKPRTMEELNILEEKIKASLYRNNTQGELNRLSRNLTLTKNVFSASLAKEDYTYYRENEKSFTVQSFLSFIEKQAPLCKITAKLDKSITELDRYRKNMMRFYECSFKRDEAFIDNIRFAVSGWRFADNAPQAAHKRPHTAILITGGFHTENLCELFKKNNISYVSIIPSFRNGNGYKSPYFNLLAGEETELQNKLYLIISSASSIQIASMLSRDIAPEVWDKANIDAFKAAILVREQIAKGRDIVDITKDGDDILFHMGDGTRERMPIRVFLDAVHQRDIDSQMERLPERNFEDIGNINTILDEIKGFLQSIGAGQQILDRVEALKGKNIDGRALVRLVHGVTFRGHAGGEGMRLNGNLKGKALKGAIIHEIIAGLFGDHFLATEAEYMFLTGQRGKDILSKATPFEMAIWDMTPEERLGVDRDFAAGGIPFEDIVASIQRKAQRKETDNAALMANELFKSLNRKITRGDITNKRASVIYNDLKNRIPNEILSRCGEAMTELANRIQPRVTPEKQSVFSDRNVIAVGDIHGNLDGLRDILEAAGLIRRGKDWQHDVWIGQDRILLTPGDIMDRGKQAKEAREYLAMLRAQARAHGGDVLRLFGNHDIAHIAEILIMPMDILNTEFWKRVGIEDFRSGVVRAAVVVNGRLWVHGKLNKTMEAILRQEIADNSGLNPDEVTKGMLADRINGIVEKAINNNDFSHELFGDNGIFWVRFNDASPPGELITQGVGHDVLKSVKLEGGHKLLGVDLGIAKGNLGWAELMPDGRIYKNKLENGRIRREELQLAAVTARGSRRAVIGAALIGGIGLGAGILAASPVLAGIMGVVTLSSLPLISQMVKARRIAGETGKAASPRETFREIVDRFGPIIGPIAFIHELVHRATAKLGIKEGSRLDEALAYGAEYALAVPAIVVSSVAYSVTNSLKLVKGLKVDTEQILARLESKGIILRINIGDTSEPQRLRATIGRIVFLALLMLNTSLVNIPRLIHMPVSAPPAISQLVEFDINTFLGSKTDRSALTEDKYRMLQSSIPELADVSYREFIKAEPTEREKIAIGKAVELLLKLDSNRARGILDAIEHIVILDVDYPAMAIDGGFVIMGKNHLNCIQNEDILRGWGLVLMHEGRHLKDAKEGMKTFNVTDLRTLAKAEESAYEETLHWVKLLGYDNDTIEAQRFIYEHIKDDSYNGLIASFVTARIELKGPALFIILSIDDALSLLHGDKHIEYLGLYKATFEGKNCFNLEYQIDGKIHRVFVSGKLDVLERPKSKLIEGTIEIEFIGEPKEIEKQDSVYYSLTAGKPGIEAEEAREARILEPLAAQSLLANLFTGRLARLNPVIRVLAIGSTPFHELGHILLGRLYSQRETERHLYKGIVKGISGIPRTRGGILGNLLAGSVATIIILSISLFSHFSHPLLTGILTYLSIVNFASVITELVGYRFMGRGELAEKTIPAIAAGLKAKFMTEKESKKLSSKIVSELGLEGLRHIPPYPGFKYGETYFPVERWANEDGKISFIRIGHLFFVHDEESKHLSRNLLKSLGGNLIKVKRFYRDTASLFEYSEWDTVTVISMIKNGVQGKRVIDCGAGEGLLSIVALKLGATSLDLIEIREDKLQRAEEQLKLNNLAEGVNYRLHHASLKMKSSLAEMIPMVEEESAIISNIGTFSDWDVTNADSIRLIEVIPDVTLFIGAGDEILIGQKSEPIERDQKLIGDMSFKVNKDIAAFEIKLKEGPALYSAWSAVRERSVSTHPVAIDDIVQHNQKMLNSEDFHNVFILESIGGNAGPNRAGVNVAVDKDGRTVGIGNLQDLEPAIQRELKKRDGKYVNICFSVLAVNTPQPGTIEIYGTAGLGQLSERAVENIVNAVIRYNASIVASEGLPTIQVGDVLNSIVTGTRRRILRINKDGTMEIRRTDIKGNITQEPVRMQDMLRGIQNGIGVIERGPIIGAMHEEMDVDVDPARRLKALRRLLQMKNIDIEAWADGQKEQYREELRAALGALGLLSGTQIDGVMEKIVVVDVPERKRIRLEGRESRIGAVIIGRKKGRLGILFPKEILDNALQGDRKALGDLLHELVELELLEGGIEADVDQAHHYAIRARDAWVAGGAEGFARVMEEMRNPDQLGEFERSFRDIVPRVLSDLAIGKKDLANLSDGEFKLIIDNVINTLKENGWNPSPTFESRFGHILNLFINREQIYGIGEENVGFKGKFGHFDEKDLILILQRLHTLAVNMPRFGISEEVLPHYKLHDLTLNIPLSNADTLNILEGIGFAGTKWEETEPNGRVLDLLRQRKMNEVLQRFKPGRPMEEVRSDIKAISTFFGVDISKMENNFILNFVQLLQEVRIIVAKEDARYIEILDGGRLKILADLFQLFEQNGITDYDFIMPLIVESANEPNMFVTRFGNELLELMQEVILSNIKDGISQILDVSARLDKQGIKIDRFIARGFDGIVLHGIDTNRGTEVAVKINLIKDAAITGDLAGRLREITQKTKEHPNFARNLFIGETGFGRGEEVVLEINEFVNGVTLQDFMLRRDLWGIELSDLLNILIQIMEGDEFLLNEVGHVNMDVRNPRNFIVTEDGVVKLVDFGNVRNLSNWIGGERQEILLDHKRRLILSAIRNLSGAMLLSLGSKGNIERRKIEKAILMKAFVNRFGEDKKALGERVLEVLFNAWDDGSPPLSDLISDLRDISTEIAAPKVPAGVIVGAMHEAAPPVDGGMDAQQLIAFAQRDDVTVAQLVEHLKDGLWHQADVVREALSAPQYREKLAEFKHLLTATQGRYGPSTEVKTISLSTDQWRSAGEQKGFLQLAPIILGKDNPNKPDRMPVEGKPIGVNSMDVISDGTPAVISCGPCLGLIIHNTKTKLTYVGHYVDDAHASSMKKVITEARNDERIGGGDEIEVVVFGTAVEYFDMSLADVTKDDAEVALATREAVVSHLIKSGFKNIYQIFPEQVGIEGVYVDFDTAKSICYVAVDIQGDDVRPMNIRDYIKLLSETISGEQIKAEKVRQLRETEDESRQAATVDAFGSVNRKADVVKAVIGVPKDMNPALVESTLRIVNRGLARNGFGKITDNHQVLTFEIDIDNPENTRQNYEKAIGKAHKGLPTDGRIVLFAPQMKAGPQLAKQAQAQFGKQVYITVIPDGYTDSHPEAYEYPDLSVRVALARHIAFYYNGNDQKSAIGAINNILRQVSENVLITGIEDLLNILKPLSIRPVVVESIVQWQKTQEAVAISL